MNISPSRFSQAVTSSALKKKLTVVIGRSSGVSNRFRSLAPDGLDEIGSSLRKHYFSVPHNCFGFDPTGYLSSPEGRRDFNDHLIARLDYNRAIFIPWLDSIRPLQNAAILEVGCGTGCAMVALAEQGADVTGLDIEEGSLQVAQDRCRIYGLNSTLVLDNGTNLGKLAAGRAYNWILFYASLEHMTFRERIQSLRDAWKSLPAGGLLGVIETPNRLWYYDTHSSLLPFFNWLQDDIALAYTRFSPRRGYRDICRGGKEGRDRNFLRRGRGISYHEFDLSIDSCENLHVAGCLQTYLRRNILRRIKWRCSTGHAFEKFLIRHGPPIHRGFYQEQLCLVLQKH